MSIYWTNHLHTDHGRVHREFTVSDTFWYLLIFFPCTADYTYTSSCSSCSSFAQAQPRLHHVCEGMTWPVFQRPFHSLNREYLTKKASALLTVLKATFFFSLFWQVFFLKIKLKFVLNVPGSNDFRHWDPGQKNPPVLLLLNKRPLPSQTWNLVITGNTGTTSHTSNVGSSCNASIARNASNVH